jgi:hypothetical protein
MPIRIGIARVGSKGPALVYVHRFAPLNPRRGLHPIPVSPKGKAREVGLLEGSFTFSASSSNSDGEEG